MGSREVTSAWRGTTTVCGSGAAIGCGACPLTDVGSRSVMAGGAPVTGGCALPVSVAKGTSVRQRNGGPADTPDLSLAPPGNSRIAHGAGHDERGDAGRQRAGQEQATQRERVAQLSADRRAHDRADAERRPGEDALCGRLEAGRR